MVTPPLSIRKLKKSKMNKRFFIFLFLIFPIFAFAQSPQLLTLPTVQIGVIMKRLADVLFTILVFLSVVFVIAGGITFVSAGGDPNRVETAKRMIIYSLIGIALGAVSFGLVNLFYSYLTRR